MSVIIFIVILVVLIVGHEFGHFIVAKLSGMKVPEFGIGFPPKLWSIKSGETEYSINALPFGGFVKIYGEDEKESLPDPTAFGNKSRFLQGLVIFAGPFMNVVIAIVLSSAAYMIGVPAVLEGMEEGSVRDARVVIADIIPGAPAALAGIERGDVVIAIQSNGERHEISDAETVVSTISNAEDDVTLYLKRDDTDLSVTVKPQIGVVPDAPDRKVIGVASALIGTVSLSPIDAVLRGTSETFSNAVAVVQGLFVLIVSSLTLTASLEGIAGPVGIASLVGEAAVFGFGSLLMFAAMISVNLAVVNLLPFPALDGGRLAILLGEGLTQRRLPLAAVSALNMVGFVILIALMLAVTAHDISRIIL